MHWLLHLDTFPNVKTRILIAGCQILRIDFSRVETDLRWTRRAISSQNVKSWGILRSSS